jgi:uridine kinase
MKRLVIGIAGGSGSGKTTIAKKLMESFSSECALLSHDYYYKPNEHMTFEERAKQNYDHPNSLETDLMVQHLKDLKDGKTIYHPTYDFANHARRPNTQKLESADIILVEGILIYEDEALRNLIDIKLFVDTDADVRFIRRLTRDVKLRGRTIESVIDQWLTTVKPMHEQFVEPSKRYANVIIPEGGHNKVAVDMIINAINKLKLSK